MASPFRLFRKYQKTLLVVAGVILMFVFVIGDALVGYLGGGFSGGPAGSGALAPNAVAVRWEGGSLTNNELDHLVMRRRLVNAFVKSVEATGAQAAIEAGVEPRPLRVERIVGVETPDQGVENDVVTTKLFADLARKAGMRISDDTIVQYLLELGRQNVTREDMRAIIQRMQVGGGRASIDYMLDALRDEMLARNYLASYHFSLLTVTPEERWQDWLKVNDRVAVEAVAFPVEKFLVDVSEPTDEQLAAFFDEKDEAGTAYKDRVPQPEIRENTELPSRHPGFAVPRRINVEFIKADYDKFLTKVENDITEEEIAKYYEENKDPLFIKADTSLIDRAPNAEPSGDTQTPATTSEPEDTDATDASAGETEQREADAGTDVSDGKTPSESSATPPPAEDTKGSETAEPTPNDGAWLRPNAQPAPFRLAAFLQESTDTPPGENTDNGTGSTGTNETTTTTPADADTPTTSPTETEPAAASAESAPSESTSEPSKPKEFQPLDEVRDDIRRELAGQRVTQQLIDLMTRLNGELEADFTKYFASMLDVQAAEDEKGEAPQPPPPTGVLADLPALAEKNGLEHGTTGPLSVLEMRETDVGKSFDAELQVELYRLLFGSKDLELYQPISTFDIQGNRYLSLMTSDSKGRTPTLAEIRDEVAKAWKLREAGKAALKHAQDVAKKVEDAGSSLSDYVADDPSLTVIRTDPFAWLTGGEVSRITGQPQPFRLSEPDGIVAAGPGFMEEVFGLGDGQVGATLNNDQSAAYVVRVANHELTPEELRAAYLAEAGTWPGLMNMTRTHAQQAARMILDEVRTGANLKWERPADQMPQDE